MNIAIPLDNNSQLCKIERLSFWELCKLENGSLKESKRYENIKDMDEIPDFIVVSDKNDDIEDFLDEGIDILIAPFQKSVEDIVEAYIFRELYQL